MEQQKYEKKENEKNNEEKLKAFAMLDKLR